MKHIVNKAIIIPKKVWTKVRQNLELIWIFGNKVNTHIPSEKCSKSNVYKTWNKIFISYIDITKYLKVWALRTHQVFIANKPVVNKSKWSADLLAINPISPLPKPIQLLASEPKPREKARKRLCIENKVEQDSFANVDILHHDKSMIRIEAFHNQLIPKLRTIWDETLGKNPEGLIRPTYELAKSVTETSSKMWELKTYDEAISKLVHGNR